MSRAALLAVLLALLLPAVAHAGTYDVWSCADANGTPVAADGWAAEGGAQFSSAVNACAQRGGLYAGLNGEFDHPAGTTRSWHFTAPADTTIAGYRIWREALVGPNNTNETPIYTLNKGKNIYDGPYVVEQCPAYGCHELGSTSEPLDGTNIVTEANLTDIRDLWLNASCGGAGGSFCRAAAGIEPDTASFRMYRAQITLQDNSDPVFTSAPSGSLNSGAVLTGTHGLSFSAGDTGGGILRYEIEVDGKTVAQQVICSQPYTTVVPCKPAASGSLSFDTASLTDGPHSARVLVVDATGSNVAAYGPFTITTANTPTSCSANPGGPAVAFDRKHTTIAYGGKLNVSGQAPPGAQVRVFTRVARAGSAEILGRTPVVADAAGKFTYRVPAGPSRSLRFAFRAGTEPSFTCSKALTVAVRARSTLKASPRTIRSGQRVRFTGKLRGGYVPRGGKLVELQAYERGRWRSITTLRTNSKGAFSYRYRFSFRAAGTTFPVRVRIRHDDSYPFALGVSSRVRVRVR